MTDQNTARRKAEETAKTLAENLDEPFERREEFVERMTQLVEYGGLSPARARNQALNECFPRTSENRLAQLLEVGQGGYSATSRDAEQQISDATLLRIMTCDHPWNVRDQFRIDDSVGDVFKEVYICTHAFPREPETYGPGQPDDPGTPQYMVFIEEIMRGEGYIGSSADRFYQAEGVVDHLYEDRTFYDLKEAAATRDVLEELGFETYSEPFGRLSPDFQRDMDCWYCKSTVPPTENGRAQTEEDHATGLRVPICDDCKANYAHKPDDIGYEA